jgi:hypothetical protein
MAHFVLNRCHTPTGADRAAGESCSFASRNKPSPLRGEIKSYRLVMLPRYQTALLGLSTLHKVGG